MAFRKTHFEFGDEELPGDAPDRPPAPEVPARHDPPPPTTSAPARPRQPRLDLRSRRRTDTPPRPSLHDRCRARLGHLGERLSSDRLPALVVSGPSPQTRSALKRVATATGACAAAVAISVTAYQALSSPADPSTPSAALPRPVEGELADRQPRTKPRAAARHKHTKQSPAPPSHVEAAKSPTAPPPTRMTSPAPAPPATPTGAPVAPALPPARAHVAAAAQAPAAEEFGFER